MTILEEIEALRKEVAHLRSQLATRDRPSRVMPAITDEMVNAMRGRGSSRGGTSRCSGGSCR